jgi:hypothetical protein
LPSPDVEAPGPFQSWKFRVELASQSEFLARKRRQANGLNEFVLLIPQYPKEVDDFAVEIVVGLNWGRMAV